MGYYTSRHSQPSMRLLGIILGGDWTGAASAMYEAGVTAKAELKS